jgi:hypothetical protein
MVLPKPGIPQFPPQTRHIIPRRPQKADSFQVWQVVGLVGNVQPLHQVDFHI